VLTWKFSIPTPLFSLAAISSLPGFFLHAQQAERRELDSLPLHGAQALLPQSGAQACSLPCPSSPMGASSTSPDLDATQKLLHGRRRAATPCALSPMARHPCFSLSTERPPCNFSPKLSSSFPPWRPSSLAMAWRTSLVRARAGEAVVAHGRCPTQGMNHALPMPHLQPVFVPLLSGQLPATLAAQRHACCPSHPVEFPFATSMA
jgi:hypothetical protein